MIRRKGIVFSILTFLLISSVLMFSMFFSVKTSEREDMIFKHQGYRSAYWSSDMAKTYFDRMGIELNSIDRDFDSIIFDFNAMYNLSDNMTYGNDINDLESFLETTFNDQRNSNLDLNITPEFTITYYNISFMLSGDSLHILTGNASAMQAITIDIMVDDTSPISDISGPTDDGAGFPTIHVIIRNSTDIILDQSPRLDPTEVNPAFSVDFSSGASIDVIFSQAMGSDGALRINPNTLQADILNLDMEYERTERTVYIQARGSYFLPLEGINSTKLNIAFG